MIRHVKVFFNFLFIVSVVVSHLGGNMLMIKRQSQIGDKREITGDYFQETQIFVKIRFKKIY